MRESKRRMVAGDHGWDGIKQPDRGAEERRSNGRENDLPDRQRGAAGEDGDYDRGERAPAAVIGGERGGDASKLCGVLRYVAHKQIGAVSEEKLRAVRHISMRL